MLQAITLGAYLVAGGLAVSGLYNPRRQYWALAISITGWCAEGVWLGSAIVWQGGRPFATLPGWLAGVVGLVLLATYMAALIRGRDLIALGGFVFPTVAALWLVDRLLALGPMRAASLSDPWVPVHVGLATLAVAAFLLAAVFGVMYTEKERELRRKAVEVFYYRLPALRDMDRMGAAASVLGLALWVLALTAGTLASKAITGRYWAWTAKEDGSLITAAVYGAYLAARLAAGWRGRPAAVWAMAAFLVVVADVLLLPHRPF